MAPPQLIAFAAHFASTLLFLTLWWITTRRLAVTRRRLATAHYNSTRDPLTGLANRAGLRHDWDHHARHAPTLALVDLDGFKPVNDQHGHAAGDHVLVVIAGRLRQICPVPARLGGDEFALILPTTTAAATAGRLAAAIAEPIGLPGGATVTVTASIGLAHGSTDLPTLLAHADAAMYRAKTHRLGVTAHTPPLDDRTSPTADPRPTVRVRDLPASPLDLAPASVTR